MFNLPDDIKEYIKKGVLKRVIPCIIMIILSLFLVYFTYDYLAPFVEYAEKNGIEISDIKTENGNERINEIEIYIKPDHSCIKSVKGFDEEGAVCEECDNAAAAMTDELKKITGMAKIDVIVLDE